MNQTPTINQTLQQEKKVGLMNQTPTINQTLQSNI